jgi:hypothetical protein
MNSLGTERYVCNATVWLLGLEFKLNHNLPLHGPTVNVVSIRGTKKKKKERERQREKRKEKNRKENSPSTSAATSFLLLITCNYCWKNSR